MNHGAKRLQELLPNRGDITRLASALGISWTVVSRWRSGERKPVTRLRVRLMELHGVELLAWDMVDAPLVPPAKLVVQEPTPEPLTAGEPPAPPRMRTLRSLISMRSVVEETNSGAR